MRLASRALATKAAAVKALASEQKALSAAVGALGASAPYDKVKALVESEPYASTMAKVKEQDLSWTWAMLDSAPQGSPVTVAVAGAGSAVGAAALYRIAAGEMLGPQTPVKLQLLGADAAVVADLEACGFPLLSGVSAATSPASAMAGAKFALLLEGDFAALGAAATAGSLVGVSGCTNALVVSKAAGEGASVTAITRGPQLAAQVGLAASTGASPLAVENVIAWGDGVSDVSHATVNGKWALKLTDEALPSFSSTTAIEADAAVAHMKDWALGSDSKWVSMGVPAVGDYGMGTGFFYSVPVVCTPGDFKRVGGVSLTPEVAAVLEKSRAELAAQAAKL